MADELKQFREGVRGGSSNAEPIAKGVLGGLEGRRGYTGGEAVTQFVPPQGGSALSPAPPAADSSPPAEGDSGNSGQESTGE